MAHAGDAGLMSHGRITSVVDKGKAYHQENCIMSVSLSPSSSILMAINQRFDGLMRSLSFLMAQRSHAGLICHGRITSVDKGKANHQEYCRMNMFLSSSSSILMAINHRFDGLMRNLSFFDGAGKPCWAGVSRSDHISWRTWAIA